MRFCTLSIVRAKCWLHETPDKNLTSWSTSYYQYYTLFLMSNQLIFKLNTVAHAKLLGGPRSFLPSCFVLWEISLLHLARQYYHIETFKLLCYCEADFSKILIAKLYSILCYFIIVVSKKHAFSDQSFYMVSDPCRYPPPKLTGKSPYERLATNLEACRSQN